MKLASFTTLEGHRGVGVVTDAGVKEIRPGLIGPPSRWASPIRQLIGFLDGDLTTLDDSAFTGVIVPWSGMTLDPIVPDPGKIVAAPVNYRDHQAEMNEDAHIDSLGFFLKSPSSVLGSGGTIALPYTDRRFDQEGEFALVIGKTASNVAPENALDHVAGYTLLLDMTMRGGEDRSTRKSFDTFTPVGPYLTTPDEVGPLGDLVLRCWVDDELRQQARLSTLIWDVASFVAYASSVTTLEPGDILTTGTPAGIGQIHDGQTIAVEVSGLGRLEANVTDVGAIACPTKGAGRGPTPPEAVTPIRALA
jgi:2-keto-4-pentenoate hydratase/2-oxohepta-3-ene-1,7-dioic acid hydratase in catechol pathway